jgi:hypothetical protein
VRGRLAAGALVVCAITTGAALAGPSARAAEASGAHLAGAAATARPASPTPPPGGHCSRVDFIGVRGSGQPFDTGGPFRGYGPEVLKSISIIEGYLHRKGVSYGAEPVKYPAASVNELNPSGLNLANPIDLVKYLNDHVDKFLASINTGVNQTVNYAEWAQQTCHNSKIIMVGYSQGAIVVHRAELLLKSRDRAAYNLIIGTVLVADGARVPNTKSREFGTSPARGEGIEDWIFSVLGLGLPFADMPFPGRTANICNNSDVVCDTSLAALVHFRASANVHATSYANCNSRNQCRYGSALINGANWVGRVAAGQV